MASALKSRRMRARGFSARHVVKLGYRYFSGIGNRATLTTALAGSNNDVTLLARTPGTGGNSIRLRIVVSGNNTALSVSVSTNDITVNSATDGSGNPTSTAKQVIDAINFSTTASPLVWAQDAPSSDGTGVVAALAYTNLSGAA